MAEDKAPNPMWTTEKLHAVIEKIYSEYEPLCKTDLGRMLARDVATVIAQQFQLFEAFGVSRLADQSACDLSNALKNQFNVQIDGVSRRLEKLEKPRRNPL